jgi:hypothetical protein
LKEWSENSWWKFRIYSYGTVLHLAALHPIGQSHTLVFEFMTEVP